MSLLGDREKGGVVCTRGGRVESFHRVHVVAVREEERVAWFGRPDLTVVYRSAAKPFQALPLVEDGVVDRFGLTGADLALTAASHNGEDPHLEGVRGILEKVGAQESDLKLGPHAPLRSAAAEALYRAGLPVRAVHNNCSGQHAGMLGLARIHGWPLESYLDPDHPIQRRMLREMVRFTGLEAEDIATMPDGCGMLAFGVPLQAMALSFARLATAAARGEEAPCRVLEAMASHPFLVAGTGRLCSALIQATDGRLVGKLGAEGVYGVAVRDQGMGIAVKVEDGGFRAGDAAVVQALLELGLLSSTEAAALETFRARPVTNTLGERVGEVVASFHLEGGRVAGLEGGSRPAPEVDREGGVRASGGEAPGEAALRALLEVSAALASRDPGALEVALERASAAAEPLQVEETLLQSYLFLGYPAALNALADWRGRAGAGEDPAEGGDWEEWRARGEEVCRVVYGGQYEGLRRNIRALHPDMEGWMVVEGYGKVLGRPGLPLATRELCIVALLAVLGVPRQLFSHLRGALHAGATVEQVETALEVAELHLDPEARRGVRDTWRRVRERARGGGDPVEDRG